MSFNSKEEEALSILAEECGETVQACMKIMRFGIEDVNPLGKTNVTTLTDEVGDILALIDILKEMDILDEKDLNKRKEYKRIKLHQWSNLFNETEV